MTHEYLLNLIDFELRTSFMRCEVLMWPWKNECDCKLPYQFVLVVSVSAKFLVSARYLFLWPQHYIMSSVHSTENLTRNILSNFLLGWLWSAMIVRRRGRLKGGVPGYESAQESIFPKTVEWAALYPQRGLIPLISYLPEAVGEWDLGL